MRRCVRSGSTPPRVVPERNIADLPPSPTNKNLWAEEEPDRDELIYSPALMSDEDMQELFLKTGHVMEMLKANGNDVAKTIEVCAGFVHERLSAPGRLAFESPGLPIKGPTVVGRPGPPGQQSSTMVDYYYTNKKDGSMHTDRRREQLKLLERRKIQIKGDGNDGRGYSFPGRVASRDYNTVFDDDDFERNEYDYYSEDQNKNWLNTSNKKVQSELTCTLGSYWNVGRKRIMPASSEYLKPSWSEAQRRTGRAQKPTRRYSFSEQLHEGSSAIEKPRRPAILKAKTGLKPKPRGRPRNAVKVSESEDSRETSVAPPVRAVFHSHDTRAKRAQSVITQFVTEA